MIATAEQAVSQYMASDECSKKIAEVAKKTCDDAIKSALGYGSDFSKQVNAAVAKCLGLHADIDLPSYNDAILKIVAKQVEACTRDAIEKQVAGRMKELLTPAPESIKLSELIDQYREHLKEQATAGCVCHGDERFACRIEPSGTAGFTDVRLNKEAEVSGRPPQWDIRFGIYKDMIYTLSFQDADVDKAMFAGPFYQFERSLFQMKAAKTKVLIDCNSDDIDTDYSIGD